MKLVNTPFASLVLVLYLTLMFSAIFVDLSLNLWVIMELSMFLFMSFSFLSMMKENSVSEGLLSYYLTQSGLSLVLLFLILSSSEVLSWVVVLVLFSKLGVVPMNLWFYSVFMKSGLLPLYYMMTLQKFPVLLFMNLFEWVYLWNTCFLILNLVICGSMALLASDLKSLLVGSSLTNNSWLAISMISSMELFFGFFLVYSVTLYLVMNGKMANLMMLSLSGLPPFPLFFLKLMVIYSYFNIQCNQFFMVVGCVYMLSALILSAAYVRYYVGVVTKVMSSTGIL